MPEQETVKISLQKILAAKAMRYNAIVIGEDQNASLYGVISAVQEATQYRRNQQTKGIQC